MEQCGNLYRRLYTDNEIGKLKIANSLWLDDEVNGQKINFKDRFLKNAAKDLYASIFSVNFSDKNTVSEMMVRWISENSNGTLTPKIEVDDNQIMSIINTIYFYDEWSELFIEDNTKEDKFYLENDDYVKCDFMHTDTSSEIVIGDGYKRSSLMLKGNGSMIFILPDENVSIKELLSSSQKIEEIFARGTGKSVLVSWSIPKFGYDSSLNLKDTLKSLGINSTSSDADFSGICDISAYISDAIQGTHISINEKGVEASAYTEIRILAGGIPTDKAEMNLNRPFIYGIAASNGTLLFVGICGNPEK
ncbi:hypothetical protein SDC9_146663 [bioreactor metagenome]|uniref:Serpin domain-containing protein n=1 Tax=bioreactor metagenome TaxID=1076179 RepID=A0A645EFT3_9ZZZZ